MTPPNPNRQRCEGLTKAGERCKANAVNGTKRCRKHPDSSDVPARDRHENWDRMEFLGALHTTGMVSAACKVAGVARSTVYLERERNEDFAERWADIDETVVENMEAEAYRRAVDGTTKPIASMGTVVAHVQEYSDGLLQFLLKAKRPHVYRERVDVQHSGKVDSGKVVFVAPDESEKREGLARILDEIGAAGNGNGNGHSAG